MDAKSLSEAYRQPQQCPRGSGVEIVGHHVAHNDKRLDALKFGLRQEVREAQALEATANCALLVERPRM